MNNTLTKMPAILAFLALAASFAGAAAAATEPGSPALASLYKTTFVRAAPGKLLDLIALYKERMAAVEAAGEERPLWWRHTNGDQWDLMIFAPMGSYTEYYSAKRVAKRRKAAEAAALSDEDFRKKLSVCSSWREDLFVMGPPVGTLRKAFDGATYFHVEIFVALPGKHEELLREREMENAYQAGIGRPEPLIFVRDQGAAWDMFTLGCYKDLKAWAGSADISPDAKEASARKAGFKSADEIGPYLRTLIELHRDTMGIAIK
jgi:hypothetical protein